MSALSRIWYGPVAFAQKLRTQRFNAQYYTYCNVSALYPSAYGRFRTWPQRGGSTDGVSNDYLRVRVGIFRPILFFNIRVSDISKNRNKSIAGALRPRVPQKHDFEEVCDIRKVEKLKMERKVHQKEQPKR